MNNQGELTTNWGDGEHTFRLTVKGVIELEQKCDAAFAVIFARLNDMTFKLSDVRETLRIGLIGGAMPPTKAHELVERYALPLIESLPIARAVVAGVMFGFEASPLGNPEAAPSGSPNPSTPPNSQEPPTSLESALTDWAKLASGNLLPA